MLYRTELAFAPRKDLSIDNIWIDVSDNIGALFPPLSTEDKDLIKKFVAYYSPFFISSR